MMADSTPFDTADLHRWRHCARRFWRHRHAAATVEAAPAPGDVGAAAALRASFPGAPHLRPPATPQDWADAQRATAAWLAAGPQRREGDALLGACLASDDGARVRIDVLWRRGPGLWLFKLRWAPVGDESDVDAVALWAHVAARCGVRLAACGLLLLEPDFVYPGHGCYAGLLREVDLSPVLARRPAASWLLAMRRCEQAPEPPALPGPFCRAPPVCPFGAACGVPASPPDRRAALTRAGRDLAAALHGPGPADLPPLPEPRLAAAQHRPDGRSLAHDAPLRAPAAARVMRALPGPRHLLRFDTVEPAVPLWPGTRPCQMLPFQWTCERLDGGQPGEPQAFLADAGDDPRRVFARTLLRALGRQGAVLAYNAGFERGRLRELAGHCDDLAEPLAALQARLVDLLPIARAHGVHPALAGARSFRAMARAVAPAEAEVDFAALGAASPADALARALQPGLAAPLRQALRDALAAHGRRQVAALRALVTLFDGADAAGRGDRPAG